MIIYKISNTINNKVYIGLTTTNIDKRFREHKNACKSYFKLGRGKTSALYNALNKYGINNFYIEQIDFAITKEELKNKEIFWIETLNTMSPNGYNLTKGGEKSEMAEEIRIKISNSHKKLNKKANTNQKKGLDIGQRRKQKLLIRLNNKTNEEKIYNSLYEAGKDGFNRKLLSRAINNRNGFHAGFYWFYNKRSEIKKPKSLSHKIIQYDLNGNLIKKFESISETKKYGFSIATVWRCLTLNKIHKKKKCIFVYENSKPPAPFENLPVTAAQMTPQSKG